MREREEAYTSGVVVVANALIDGLHAPEEEPVEFASEPAAVVAERDVGHGMEGVVETRVAGL